jgi:uncharacterized membrane protein YfcA
MDETILLPSALLLGLASGFIGGVATGGGLVSIPGLMFMGLPPSAAIATNNLNVVSGVTSALRFHKAQKLQIRRMLPLLFASFFGSLVGSKLLLHIDQTVIQRAFAIASIILAITFVMNKGPRSVKRGKIHALLGIFAVFLGSVFAGLFGTGGGFFVVYILCYFYGLSIMEANANTKVINVAGTISVIAVFLHAGLINFQVGVPMMVGSTVGGYIGAHTALKNGEGLVKVIFLLVVFASGIKLLFA